MVRVCVAQFVSAPMRKFSTEKLIVLRDGVHSRMSCIERYSMRNLVLYCSVVFLFHDKRLNALVICQNVTIESQLIWLYDKILEAELLLWSIKQHEEALLRWARTCGDVSAKWHKHASKYGPFMRQLLDVDDCVKS